MTHDEAVLKAVTWLTNKGRCTLAGSEFNVWSCAESPDAIGWDYEGRSTVIEAKVSRSDFKADAKKLYRSGHVAGLGAFRYYLVPAGLVKPDEVPEGWGLIEVIATGGTRTVKKSKLWTDRNLIGENVILVSLCRGLKIGDYSERHNIRIKVGKYKF